MSIKERVEQAIQNGEATYVVVYCNLGNNTDELIICDAGEADDAGAVIVDVYYVQHNAFMRTMIITAEVV